MILEVCVRITLIFQDFISEGQHANRNFNALMPRSNTKIPVIIRVIRVASHLLATSLVIIHHEVDVRET